ncbi:flagellar motor switch protein FliG [Methyloglobulus morosus KoM1]|uniref:Flagellar motor switch protein FliG n=1 Tax=Methyloglobulus morosus KoM1 TaxID=1116472 RepID=V5C980_9GAMM|nr:flagellar motor switch protein FliG [Methyloglobulus morosus]ESS73333.1 flagellar motor switch protein FliG [Methyloglobulus morosus KoM1]
MEEMSQADRAALLLFALGEERASAVLKHMDAREVQLIGYSMARLRDISPDMINVVLGEVIPAVKHQTSLGVDSDGYIRSVLIQSLGEDKATSVIERIFLSTESKGIEQLKYLDPKSISDLVRLEHPQIGAIILSMLGNDKAAEVMQRIPEHIRSDLMLRIATMQGVQPGALRELDAIMEKQLSGSVAVKATTIGGIEAAASILNFMDGSASNLVLKKISESDAELATKIQDKMFVFEDLTSLSGSDMQTLLREVPTELLLLALRGSSDELKEKIYANMSKRAAEILRDDLEASPPAKLSDVEKSQKEILSIAKQLMDSGIIIFSVEEGDELI